MCRLLKPFNFGLVSPIQGFLTVHSRRVYLLALTFLALSCTVGERREATVTRSWPAAGIRMIKITEVEGSLSVHAGAADQILLVAHVRTRGARGDKDEPNSGYFRTEIDGDTLRIGQRGRGHIQISIPFFHARPHIDYVLQVPSTVALDLKTVNGRITTRGTEGEAELVTVNGGIDAETAGFQELFAKAVNGHVRAKFLRDFNGATLKTVNGKVEAILPPSASFTCNLSQVNGDFEASFPLSIHSNPGSRRVSGEVNGGRHQLQITTVNGDVEVQHLNVPPVPPVPEIKPVIPPVPPAPSRT
jgi:putative adhesin